MGPHGIRGQVRVRSITEDPESLFSYGALTDQTSTKTFSLTKRGMSKDEFIASIKGVTNRNEAETLKNIDLYIDRAVLPDLATDEYYLTDLVGLTVREQNKDIGTIDHVYDYGAGLFLEIKPNKGKSFMLPFKDEFVPTVDIKNGFVETRIPEDWLKEEKKPS